QKPRGDVFGERNVCVAFDGDVVVVEDPTKVVESKMTRKRCCFAGDSLHQAAVPTHGVDFVVEDLEFRTVVPCREPLLRDRHSYARCDALSEGSRSGLDARYPPVLRMSWSPAIQLPEVADVLERNRLLPQPFVLAVYSTGLREMEHR